VTKRPVLLLDVDGVLNAFQPSWGDELTRTNVAGLPIRWAPAMIERLREIHRSGLVEIRWCTTWCGLPVQLRALGELFGLDIPAAFGDRPMSKTWGDLKVEAAIEVIAEGRLLIWADDEEAAAARRLFPVVAAAENAGRALLLTPESRLGLQPEDLDAIEAFLKENA
jgi:hypothetical protein